jgi:hypothetical protein
VDKASGAEVGEAARLAGECAVTRQALALARWIGAGRHQVTAGKVLRKADVPAASAAIGVAVSASLRTMADVPSLHRPWRVAVATGLLSVRGGWVTSGPALESWPSGDEELLDGWLAGLTAVCAAESYPQDEGSVGLLVLATLTAASANSGRRPGDLWDRVYTTLYALCEAYGMDFRGPLDAASRYWEVGEGQLSVSLTDLQRIDGLVRLLAEFGMVSGGVSRPVVTPLGRWGLERLRDGLVGPADPSLTAAELIAEAVPVRGDAEQLDHVVSDWLGERDPVEAARELLAAASQLRALGRSVAAGLVQRLGEQAQPAWREVVGSPLLRPHARQALADLDAGPEPDYDNWQWLRVEAAAAALEEKGPDEALTELSESMAGPGLEEIFAEALGTGHPDAPDVVRAAKEFAASGAPRSVDTVAELKVTLLGYRPACWRRVDLPVTATLGEVHDVIQELFGWDGDHLHVFSIGKKHYSDPFMDLEETGDEEEIRVKDAFAAGDGGKVAYTYDFGANWRHEITLEKTFAREQGQAYPVCVAFKGDSPVEYWNEEDPQDPERFDLARVNRHLARLRQEQELSRNATDRMRR